MNFIDLFLVTVMNKTFLSVDLRKCVEAMKTAPFIFQSGKPLKIRRIRVMQSERLCKYPDQLHHGHLFTFHVQLCIYIFLIQTKYFMICFFETKCRHLKPMSDTHNICT